MFKSSYLYKRLSVQLLIEGLSDQLTHRKTDKICILTQWTLKIVGKPQLEGKLTQLVDLVIGINEYASYLISTSTDPFKSSSDLVSINPQPLIHRIILSSRLIKESITLELDDSQLIDLVYCIDDLRLDPNIKELLRLPQSFYLHNCKEKKEIFYQFASPFLALLLLSSGIALAMILPFPSVYNLTSKLPENIAVIQS